MASHREHRGSNSSYVSAFHRNPGSPSPPFLSFRHGLSLVPSKNYFHPLAARFRGELGHLEFPGDV